MTSSPEVLVADALRRSCLPESFDFATTAELPPLEDVLGQPRAVAALELGASISSSGFNLFALGAPGSGKTTLIHDFLTRRALTQAVPPDLCYVNKFSDDHHPLALRLPAGMGARLQRDMDGLVAELQESLPKAFERKEYEALRDQIASELEQKRMKEFGGLETEVTEHSFQLVKLPGGGMVLVPAWKGKPLAEHDLEQLSQDERDKLVKLRDYLGKKVEETLRHIREIEKGARDALRALDKETATRATRHIVDDLRPAYAQVEAVGKYLDAVQADVVEHADDFRGSGAEQKPALPFALPAPSDGPFARYKVNVLVDNSGLAGAPVVLENNPTYHNLVGRIEHQSVMGAVTTNFTMLKAGALHRAHGGYLMIPARECLTNPYAWEGLKRALKERAVRIEELGTQLSLVSTVTLEPEPVPLDVKVILIGSPMVYYLLYAYDEDFQKLFKVKADFTTHMERSPDTERAYALFISTIARQDKLPPFDREAVAAIVEYGTRLADDQDRLSTRFGEIADLVREAAHRARAAGDGAPVTGLDVARTIEARRYRQNLLEEDMQQAVRHGTLLIDTTGEATGRINGLSVIGMGDYAFGHPSRITASTGPGRGGVVSIEREVDLSGPIHGKGVLILGGYLARQYAGGPGGRPLSLNASLVFEQSYGMVEGDSASMAELYALLSALSGIPLKQGIAVTGSVNQHGQSQAVGGVTEKIEGFFEVCQSRGLTGEQGVLIPEANRRHLMLRPDVVNAVRDGRFHVWVTPDVDTGLALMTGREAGARGEDGRFAEGTVHRAVMDRLAAFSAALRAEAEGKSRGERAAYEAYRRALRVPRRRIG